MSMSLAPAAASAVLSTAVGALDEGKTLAGVAVMHVVVASSLAELQLHNSSNSQVAGATSICATDTGASMYRQYARDARAHGRAVHGDVDVDKQGSPVGG